jgi:hypothetical protein
MARRADTKHCITSDSKHSTFTGDLTPGPDKGSICRKSGDKIFALLKVSLIGGCIE